MIIPIKVIVFVTFLPTLFVQVLIENGETVSGLHFIVTSSAVLLYVATLHDVILFYVGKNYFLLQYFIWKRINSKI